MYTWLTFFLICFIGIAFMFFCLLRRQDAMIKTMREEHAQFKALLRSIEARCGAGDETHLDDYAGSDRDMRLSVDEALDAYARKERLDMDAPGAHNKGMPDLKF